MVPDREAPERAAGIDFEALDALAGHDFPTSAEALVEAYGDVRLAHQRGEARLGDLLEPVAGREFETPEAVHQTILTLVGEAAVGREGYSDRDPTRRDTPEAEDRSFRASRRPRRSGRRAGRPAA